MVVVVAVAVVAAVIVAIEETKSLAESTVLGRRVAGESVSAARWVRGSGWRQELGGPSASGVICLQPTMGWPVVAEEVVMVAEAVEMMVRLLVWGSWLAAWVCRCQRLARLREGAQDGRGGAGPRRRGTGARLGITTDNDHDNRGDERGLGGGRGGGEAGRR